MTDLISREAAIAALQSVYNEMCGQHGKDSDAAGGAYYALQTLSSLPSVDSITAKWAGDDEVLPIGATVTVLAIDLSDPAVPARKACWVRWQEERCMPSYRSCDLSDLDLTDGAYEALLGK